MVYNIGAGHKLDPIEIANNMMAYRNSGFLPLNDDAVHKVIKNNFNALQVNPFVTFFTNISN